MSSELPFASEEPRRSWILWAGLLVGPIAWLTQMQVVYSLAQWVCLNEVSEISLHVSTLIGLALTLVGVGFAAYGGRLVKRHWAEHWSEISVARGRFLSTLGLMSGALFTLLIIAQWLALFFLGPCPV